MQLNYNNSVAWDKVRNLEFAIYNTTFAGMSGEKPYKKIKKPSDLYKLPTDNVNFKPVKVDKERALADVQSMKEHFKWQN